MGGAYNVYIKVVLIKCVHKGGAYKECVHKGGAYKECVHKGGAYKECV